MMKDILCAPYEELTLAERCNALPLARQRAREEAGADNGSAGGVEQLTATAADYYARIVEPAWHAEIIDDDVLDYWKSEKNFSDDPRVDAFCREWQEHQADEWQEYQGE